MRDQAKRPSVAGTALFRYTSVVLGSCLALGGFIGGARAQATNLVQNGTFSQALVGSATTASAAIGSEFGSTNNGFTPAQTLVGWTTAGYNYVYLPNTVDTIGDTGQYNLTATTLAPGIRLWGPGDGSANTPTGGVSIEAPPTGGNFIAADGAYEVSAITQQITGLTAGKSYNVSFTWAGAQQYGYTSPTTEQWAVSLGGTTDDTSVVSPAGEGFSGWMNQTFTYVATSSSELLSFLAIGTPGGQPPFALLSNVSVTQVPEPATWAIMLTGLLALLATSQRRARRRGAVWTPHTIRRP
jgi:hypothetical protein